MARTKQLKGLPEGQRDLITEGVLGDGFAVPEVAKSPTLARWTGEQVKRHRPQVHAAAVKLLAAGLGTVDIAELLHISPHTVALIRDSESSLAIEKERLGRLFGKVARLAAEGLAEDLADDVKRAKMPANVKAMVAGIATDKLQVLSGGPTSVVANFNANLDAGAWGAAMGSGGEKVAGQKGDGVAPMSGWPVAGSEGAGQGDAAPRAFEGRESRSGEVIDLPASPATES